MDKHNISVVVWYEGTECVIEDDGCLGYLVPPRVTLKVRIPPSEFLWGFTVDGKKNVQLKRDLASEMKTPMEGRLYTARIEVKRANPYLDSGVARGICHTEYPANNMRLLELSPDGRGSIYEIAVVSQNGIFFLTRQTTWRFGLFRENGHVACPYFREEVRRWLQLEELIQRIFPAEWVDALAPAQDYQLDDPANESLREYTGRVSWYNLAQGIGAVETAQGAARIHWTQVPPRPRFRYLGAGEKVAFQRLREPKETKLRRSAYLFEVEGVLLS